VETKKKKRCKRNLTWGECSALLEKGPDAKKKESRKGKRINISERGERRETIIVFLGD